LPPEDEAKVTTLLHKQGVVSRISREQVTEQDLIRLRPRQWLNDEIINFYGALISARSEECKENPGNGSTGGRGKPLNVHYFSTFFWSKLRKEGYDRGRLAKWTKKVQCGAFFPPGLFH
jgi:sentrin-specific protease 1